MLVKVVGFLSVHLFVLVRHCAIEKSHSRGRSQRRKWEKEKSEIYLWPIENHCSHCLWLCSQSPSWPGTFFLSFFAKKVNRSVGASDVIVGSEHIHKQSDYYTHTTQSGNGRMADYEERKGAAAAAGAAPKSEGKHDRKHVETFDTLCTWMANKFIGWCRLLQFHNVEWMIAPGSEQFIFYLYRSTFFRLHVSLLFFFLYALF